MRQVIPFSKNIEFKTKISSINSISLEHNLKLDGDNTITGSFSVSGDYKITDSSKNTTEFNYNIPFDIILDNSYNTSEVAIDIDDFYYEIVDDKILKVNIDVAIDGDIKEIEDNLSVEDEILNTMDNKIDSFDDEDDLFVFKSNDLRKNDNIKEDDEMKNEIIEETEEDIDDKKINDMFSVIDNEAEDTFTTYNVHIVKESETLDMILKKYNITKDQFLEYNQEDEVVLGNKLLIPSNNE